MYTCEFCNKKFTKESTLFVHKCEKKRRFMQRNEKHVQLGFRAYQLFYKISTNAKKDKTYDEFSKSQYYTAFVKYGNYCVDLRIDDVPSLTAFLLDNRVRIDRWTSDKEYIKWIKHRQKSETVERAVERTVMFLQEYCEENNVVFNNYFDDVSVNVIVFHITSGKLSPWIIFASDKAQQLLDCISTEHVKMILDFVDVNYWQKKVEVNPKDYMWVKEIMKEANL